MVQLQNLGRRATELFMHVFARLLNAPLFINKLPSPENRHQQIGKVCRPTVGDDVVVPWEANGFPYRFFVAVIRRRCVSTLLERIRDLISQ